MFKKLLAVLLVYFILSGNAFAALTAGTVWEVRPTVGSDTNSCGFVAGGTGTDYSQQNSKNTTGSNISTTDAVAAGTTTITSVTAAFTTAINGNLVYLAGGTGSLTGGWYAATYVSATSITVDRTVATGTGITLNIGGACNSLAPASTAAVASNKIFMKASGTYSTTSALPAFTASTLTFIGYNTTRTDAGSGGQPLIQASTTTGLTVWTLPANSKVYNITIDCNSLATCTAWSLSNGGDFVWNVKAKNYATAGIIAYSAGVSAYALYSEVTGGTLSTGIGISLSSSNGNTPTTLSHGNYVHDGNGAGMYVQGMMVGNIVSNMSGTGTNGYCYLAPFEEEIINNIAYNCGGDAFRLYFNSGTAIYPVLNNIAVSNGGYGMDNYATASPASPFYDGNAFYGNASGTRNNINDTTTSSSSNNGVSPYTNVNDVILTSSPFVNAASGNFALNSTSGAGAALRSTGVINTWPGLAGTTGYVSFGPVQPQQTTISGGAYTFGQ